MDVELSVTSLLGQPLPPTRMTKLGSGSIEYRQAGESSGDTAVLLHGLGSSSAGYRAQLAGLSNERRRLVAWNAPGFGASAHLSRAEPEVGEYAASLLTLVDALGESKVDIVGSSWGSLIAAEFARLHPEKVRTLVLVVPTAGYAHLSDIEKAAQIKARLSSLRIADDPARVALFLADNADAAAVTRFLELRAAVTERGFEQATRMLYRADPMAIYGELAVRTLIIAGDQDRVSPSAKIQLIHGRIPRSSLRFLTGCGHIPKLEKPEEFNGLLRDFWYGGDATA